MSNHEDTACFLLQNAEEIDTSDDYGVRRKTLVLIEANAQANLAAAEALSRLARAVERVSATLPRRDRT